MTIAELTDWTAAAEAGHAELVALRRAIHAANDGKPVTEAPLQHINVADAILQADDGRAGVTLLSDFVGCFRGGAAFDAQCDYVGICQRLAIGSIIDLVGWQRHFPSAVIAQRQAMLTVPAIGGVNE